MPLELHFQQPAREAPEIKESSRAKGGSASRGLVSEAERIGLWVELLLTG